MTWIKRSIVIAIGAVIMGAPALSGLGSSSDTAPDPVTITNHQAEMTVDADGSMRVEETLTADFPAGRHGLFRFWDLADSSDPGARLTPSDIEISRDGKDEPFDLSWDRGRRFKVAKIGSEDVLLQSGEHVYTIAYRVEDAVTPADRGAGPNRGVPRLDWWAVAPGWRIDILRSSTTLNLPQPAGTVECEVIGGASACQARGQDSRTVDLETGEVPMRTGVSTQITLPDLEISRPDVPWSIAWDALLGTSPIVVGVIVLLTGLALILGQRQERRARESSPGAPLTYEPPEGWGPVQVEYLISETTGDNALTSTILHMAESRLVTLEEGDDRSWTIIGIGTDSSVDIDPVSRAVARALGVDHAGGRFEADGSVSAGKKLQKAIETIPKSVGAWAHEAGLVESSNSERRDQFLAVVAIFVAGLIVLLFQAPGIAALPLIAFAVGGAGLFSSGAGQRRTATGRRAWAECAGFKRILTTDSAHDRFDFSARRDAYTAYVPFAVAFDAADAWAEKYVTETGQEPPSPDWYRSRAGGTALFGGGTAAAALSQSFDAAVSSSISAYTASQRSSSSGGGRSAGGGGGGGGSW